MDANFSGEWYQSDYDNAENVISCTRYVITYAGFPLLWWSKLETEIALGTTKAEYIVLIQLMREVIPFMSLIN